MSQQQLDIVAIGSAAEALCEAVLGRIAAMVRVPRQHDFGIDYYCVLRESSGARVETELAPIWWTRE